MRVLLLLPLLALPLPARADFARDVKPVLDRHCIGCHGPDKQRASLRLDAAATLLEGGSSGPAVTAGKSGESLIVRAMLGVEGVNAMPPKGERVSAADIARVRKWIDDGAKPPANEVVARVRTKSDHWSFQPVRRTSEPAVTDAGWARNGIDRFILARLERERIKPSSEADAVTLLRRLHLDLTGIPPTPAEVDAFLADKQAGAYERAVDILLASPAYGERWGRHWLDQARYADSNGYSIDAPRAIWKYRDWVIAALNRDLPFDQFTIDQLAGDLVPGATTEQKVATGFHRNTQINEEGGIDLEQFRVEAIVDRTNTTATVWLGLTLGCAQCHDHKFDPLAQKEYYQFYAFFNHSDDPKLALLTDAVAKKRQQLRGEIATLEKQLLAIDHLSREKIDKLEGSLSADSRLLLPKRIQTILAIAVNGRTPKQQQDLDEALRRLDSLRHTIGGINDVWATAAHTHLLTTRQKLAKQIDAKKKELPADLTTMVLNERKMPRMTTIQLGGDFLRKGANVKPDVPSVLPPLPAREKLSRLDLAKWLVDGKNPLVGRVLMNRLWQAYFGQGLVETENDFGTQGTKPSHPELLDWLADELVRREWSLKAMHRLIVTSATYRQSSHARPDLRITDPRNLLLARQNRIRLEAEVIRDVTLASSGLLTPTIGGPGVHPPQVTGVYSLTQVPKNWIADLGPDRFRRGLYTFFWRSAPHPNLTVFDAPDATATCTRRNRSNTPLQALTLLNDQAHVEGARALAGRILSESTSDEERLTHGFRLTLARPPKERERSILLALLAKQRAALKQDMKEAKSLVSDTAIEGIDASEQAAWVQMARVLLNLDEFITRE